MRMNGKTGLSTCAAMAALALSVAAAGCGNDGGSGTDTSIDTGLDTTGDDGTTPTEWRTCARSCTAPADCCITGGAACGTFPNNWECDGACAMGGCSGDAECVTWATGLSLPGAADFKCSATLLFYETNVCVKGCAGAAECCPTGTDCSVYPNRYSCEGAACKPMGCVDTAECVAWATSKGAADAALYECGTFGFSGMPVCAKTCTTTADCCSGTTCPGYPQNLACLEGHCLSTCSGDPECSAWATAQGAADPSRYVCHTY